MLVPTTTSEPPSIAYLTPLLGQPKLSFTFWEIAWSHREVRRFGECGGAAADRHSSLMRASGRGGDAGSNHHFRAAKYRAFDTLFGQLKLRITGR